MDRGVACPRLVLGRDLTLVMEREEGVEIEGRGRLRPGRDIEIVRAGGSGAEARRAEILSWRIVQIGSDGVLFRGFCRWR
jgi:hypothetical protein